ncbi:MAG: preprotein translocase subunit SecG [Oscillospiraceae bacterium]|nr:preprotein translocase subunit SecG [Oscillospiraceae bacterium]
MEAIRVILTIIQVISAVILIAIVSLQSGKSEGLSASIGGGSGETFFSKNKAATLDGKLAKATKWFAAVFIVLTLVLNIL